MPRNFLRSSFSRPSWGDDPAPARHSALAPNYPQMDDDGGHVPAYPQIASDARAAGPAIDWGAVDAYGPGGRGGGDAGLYGVERPAPRGHSLLGGGFAIEPPDPDDDPALDAPPAPVPLPGLRGITPDAKYVGEDQNYGWRADNNAALRQRMASSDPAEQTQARQDRDALAARTDLAKTVYLNEGERRAREIAVGPDGLLRRASGEAMDTSLGGGGGLNPTGGREVFALGVDGALNAADGTNGHGLSRLFRSPEGHLDGEAFHHTAFYNGGAVAGAGEIGVENGQLRSISDQSGHYRPDAGITHQAVDHLANAKGVKMVDDTPDDSGHAVNKPVDVLLGGKNPGEDEVKLTHQQFLQTMGNETQIRAKRGLNEAIALTEGLTPSQARAAQGLTPPEQQEALRQRQAASAPTLSGYGQAIPAPTLSGYGVQIPVAPPLNPYGQVMPIGPDLAPGAAVDGLPPADLAPLAPPALRRPRIGRHRG